MTNNTAAATPTAATPAKRKAGRPPKNRKKGDKKTKTGTPRRSARNNPEGSDNIVDLSASEGENSGDEDYSDSDEEVIPTQSQSQSQTQATPVGLVSPAPTARVPTLGIASSTAPIVISNASAPPQLTKTLSRVGANLSLHIPVEYLNYVQKSTVSLSIQVIYHCNTNCDIRVFKSGRVELWNFGHFCSSSTGISRQMTGS